MTKSRVKDYVKSWGASLFLIRIEDPDTQFIVVITGATKQAWIHQNLLVL